jgi:riboflavin synthase
MTVGALLFLTVAVGAIAVVPAALENTALGDAARITVHGPLVVEGARHGDSIAVSGVCLTVVDQTATGFTADVMAQTLKMSTLSDAAEGRAVNLERAAKVGDRLGGHIVQGHIDGTATVTAITEGSAWRVVRFSLDAEHAPLVVDKGSIALDGTSLTVSAVGDDWFEVSLIPETLTATTLGERVVGEKVNLETDIIARHVERMLALAARTPVAAAPTTDTPEPSAVLRSTP